MKKNNQTGKKRLSLEKLQIAKINNIKSIKGGFADNQYEDYMPTRITTIQHTL